MPVNKQIRILLIEDDEDDYIITKELLLEDESSKRFEIVWTTSPSEGLNLILDESFDVYLIDLYLGRYNGLDIIAEGITGGCKKPLILLTGSGDQDHDLRALEIGAADYLIKGQFSADTLKRSIQYAIRHRETLSALALSEARYRAVIESQTELICRFNTAGTLTFVNEAFAKSFGYYSNEMINQSLSIKLPAQINHQFSESIKTIVTSKMPSTFENRTDSDNSDESIWQQWTVLPIFGKDKEILEIQAVGVDITNRKQAEIVLRKALDQERELGELKSRFVTMASHEFRTPLTTIMSTSSFLEMAEDTISSSKRIARLAKIQQATRNMTQLLDDVLVFGKAEADKLDYHPSWLNLKAFCDELIEDIRAASQNSHDIEVEDQLTMEMVYSDESLLRQIITNLVTNAIKYSPKGSKIDIVLSNDEHDFSVIISDNGIGIP
ncbi:MAG: PAS domain S-box protein, partial [Anaerolineae bacterium]